mmetsp:Transcript_119153/g.371199  ORF Transcript_119153/g.371199 Transcript_119153/m.371199 type:complete len:161 (+) Transcript_119153:391-873(+)
MQPWRKYAGSTIGGGRPKCPCAFLRTAAHAGVVTRVTAHARSTSCTGPLAHSLSRTRTRELQAAMPSVEQTIAQNDMVVYASSTCPFCEMALGALKEAGYDPLVIETTGVARNELAAKYGSSSVPKVFVKGKFVGGCNDGGMGGTLPLLQSGKIKELMSE